MRFQVHKIAAEYHFRIASELDMKISVGKNIDEKDAARVVAAQNYFYSAVNIIESVLAKNFERHSFNQENRLRLMIEHRDIFSDEILEIYEVVDRNLRNKVAYRGENGPKYKGIKLLAELLVKRFP